MDMSLTLIERGKSVRRFLTILIATLAVVGLTVTLAHAAPRVGTATIAAPGAGGIQPDSFADCPAGVTCIWYDINGGGTRGVIAYSQNPPGTCWNLPVSPTNWRNVISSAEVQFGSGWGVRWFASTGCSGGSFDQPHLTRINMPDVVDVADFWNDQIESFYLIQA